MSHHEVYPPVDLRALPQIESDFTESPLRGFVRALDRLEDSEAVALVFQGVRILVSRERMVAWVRDLQQREKQAVLFQAQPGEEIGRVYERARRQRLELALSVQIVAVDPATPAYRVVADVIRKIESDRTPFVSEGRAVTAMVDGEPVFYLTDIDVMDRLFTWLQEAKANRTP